MSAYLDTHVAVWLAQGSLDRISPAAMDEMSRTDLLLSPVSLLELQYLYEIGRVLLSADDLRSKLGSELGVRVCGMDLASVCDVAIHEAWTRDPFDRLIVANAKANGLSPLVSADEDIRVNYVRTVW